MASSRQDESASPSTNPWQDIDTDMTEGSDDAEFELATEEEYSEISTDADGDEEETTIYFDAEEGRLEMPDGTTLEVVSDNEEEDDGEAQGEEEEEEGGEGSRTPQATASTAQATGVQRDRETITSTSDNATAPTARPGILRRASSATQRRILRLLSNAGIRGIFQPGGMTTRSGLRTRQAAADEDEDAEQDDDDDGGYYGYSRRSRRNQRTVVGDRYPKIPSEEGQRLMQSGTFGTNDHCDHSACGLPYSQTTINKRRKLSRRMFDREMGVESRGRQRALNALATQDLIPNSKADLIVNLNARCYSGQFSEDGSFFFACGQDFKVRMYDTSNPHDWKYYKTVHYYGGQWTITDATLSPDNKHLAYSSIRSQICLANTDQGDTSEPRMLDFSDMTGAGGSGPRGYSRGHFGIWSLRFSGDGGEIVAGTSDASVYVYDLESQRSILRIPGHTDDVNAVCFGDKMSPHILYSGSDDTTVKVWDRRSLASMRPAGMFLGHTEGVTYIDSKGDGRYVISNGKDQTCKLWDLRKMVSTDQGERLSPQDYTTHFDYRFSPYDTDDHQPHPHDCSLVTFRGHRVLKTLIRCHFSPPGSTDGRYVYSGSHDGKIYVWNLDGTRAAEPINVLEATRGTRPVSDERYVDRYDYHGNSAGVWKTIVRDCSWHPHAPVLAATSWNGWDHGLGTVTVHSWNDGAEGDEVGERESGRDNTASARERDYASLGSTPMGARVTAQLQHDERYYGNGVGGPQARDPRRTRMAQRMGLGNIWGDDDEDE